MEGSIMNWTSIVNFLGGSALILTAVGVLVKLIVTHFLNRDLERVKGEIKADNDRALEAFRKSKDEELEALRERRDKELQRLREAHEKALAEFQASANERIAHVTAALATMDRLQAEILKSRGDAYGVIWKLTGSMNVFGAPLSVNCAELSAALTEWYFSRGWVLTEETKKRYFLFQEVLNFVDMRAIPFKRPSGELLYGDADRPIEVVRRLRSAALGIERRGDEGDYSIAELEACVSNWKSARLKDAGRDSTPQEAWLLLQFVMSQFRSRLAGELGSRSSVQTLATPSKLNSPAIQVAELQPGISSF
jgi:hypothetical protein